MKRSVHFTTFFAIAICMSICALPAKGQEPPDSLTNAWKSKILGKLNHFTFGLYIDTYVNYTLDHKSDTSNLVPLSANCPVRDQIRINVAAIEVYYNDDRVRGKLALQYGDQPNLLAAPEMQFIKTIRQANFGFRIAKDLWIDLGYLFNPIGYESTWTVLNQISTVTIGGYFEPASLLGAKLSYRFSPKFIGGMMIGNPFSLAYASNTRLGLILFLTWDPVKNLTVTYNNIFGNRSLYGAEINHYNFYNNLIVNYFPISKLMLTGQLDFCFETNAKMPPDTTSTGSLVSGFFQAHYKLNNHFALSGRLEAYHDPDGILSGLYSYDNKQTGLTTYGYTLSAEYKPVSFGFIRLAYRYLQANQGNNIFYGKTSDLLRDIIFTAGVRF